MATEIECSRIEALVAGWDYYQRAGRNLSANLSSNAFARKKGLLRRATCLINMIAIRTAKLDLRNSAFRFENNMSTERNGAYRGEARAVKARVVLVTLIGVFFLHCEPSRCSARRHGRC